MRVLRPPWIQHLAEGMGALPRVGVALQALVPILVNAVAGMAAGGVAFAVVERRTVACWARERRPNESGHRGGPPLARPAKRGSPTGPSLELAPERLGTSSNLSGASGPLIDPAERCRRIPGGRAPFPRSPSRVRARNRGTGRVGTVACSRPTKGALP